MSKLFSYDNDFWQITVLMSFSEVKNMKFDNETDRMLLVSVLQSYFHFLEAKFPFLACKCFHSPLATCQWLPVDEGRWGRVQGR